MRRILPLLLLLSAFAGDACLAQANAVNVVCEDCRDAQQYPADYVNFAFNQLYGPDAWMTYDQADDFFITNLDQQTVYVDVDFVFLGLGFRGMRLPFWPTYVLRFNLALPNGTLYRAFRSVFQTSLPVPASSGDTQNDTQSSGGSAGGGDDGDDEDFDEYDDFDDYDDEWEDADYDDYEGYVEIEDPDENGDFEPEDWHEEL